MRERFEAWVKLEGLDISIHDKFGFYLSPITYRCWKAFKEGAAK